MAASPRSATARFVESIPLGLEDLATKGVELTADALIRLTEAAEKTIDLTAMYWTLRANPDHAPDEKGWSREYLEGECGAARGEALFRALDDAAGRGVKIRILESPGFDKAVPESELLRRAHPGRITVRRVEMEDWFGFGIMHQKIWVFDGHAVYIGSANMDWKSLTQVKEIGIVVEHAGAVAREVTGYFETWWTFASLDPAAGNTVVVFDARNQMERKVPAWSPIVPPEQAIPNPLDVDAHRTESSWERPLHWSADGEVGHLVLSGAPVELCVGDREFDGDLLVDTILDASASVCINVMDWAPVSLYRGSFDDQTRKYMLGTEVASPVWWPVLIDALLEVVMTRQVHGRLLVSEWAHTSEFIRPYLNALAAVAEAAFAKPSMTSGTLEIRRFRVPGWRATGPKAPGGPTPRFPGHTRVNHVKYIVTDRRINIGTSNMTWDYFDGTAGTSFNTTQPSLVTRLQQIFDRDWSSDYALPIGS
jgi:phospholipase D3/4